MENTSPKYSLNKSDLYKIGRGLLITIGGTVLTYLTAIVGQINWIVTISGVTVNLTPLLIPVFGALIEAGRRLLTNYAQ